MTDLAKLVVKLEAQTAEYQAGLEKANRMLAKFDKQAGLSAAKIAGTLAGAAVTAATTFALLGKRAIDNADHFNDLSKTTGVSTESLSKFEFAAKQSGANLDAVGVGLKKLNLSMSEAAGNADSKAAVAFRAMGVSIRDASGEMRSADDVFIDVADRMAGYKDGANKNALANAILGKSYDQLIPLLDEGGEGIRKMGEQAQAAGVIISQDTARAADEFNDRVGLLQATIDGFSNRVASELLPNLNKLADVWDNDSGRMEAFHAAAMLAADAIRVLVSAGIIVVSVFQQIGQAIYSVGVAYYKFMTLDFKGMFEELKSGSSSIVDNIGKDIEKLDAIWGNSSLNPDNKKDGAPKLDAPNVAGLIAAENEHAASLKKLESEAENARKQLKNMGDTLSEQVATYGMSDAAATEYRLTLGSMADEVAKAGENGKQLAQNIIDQANALEKLKNADALKDVDQQIMQLTGHTKEATIAAFDLQNALLKASLVEQGDDQGQKKLDSLRKLIAAQAEYNELELKAESIRDDLLAVEERIQHTQEVGALNELEALAQLDAARKDAVARLQEILDKQKAIADQSGNVELQKAVKDSARALEGLRNETDLLVRSVRVDLEDSFADAFEGFISGADSADDALKNFMSSIENIITDFVAKDLSRRLFNSIFEAGAGAGGMSGNGSGGWMNAAMSMFGGSRDSGGKGKAGKAYLIGVGAQPEIFVPDQPGTFIPAGRRSWMEAASKLSGDNFEDTGDKHKWIETASNMFGSDFGGVRDAGGPGMAGKAYAIGVDAQPELFVPSMPRSAEGAGGGMTVKNYFTIQAPNGTVTRRTEAQIGAAASRGIASANMRNN